MSEEILINVTPQETRVAVVENGVLQEVHIERTRNRGIAGNVYKGKIRRILPGMQAAFVDIGLERAAFLQGSDIKHPYVSNEDVDHGGQPIRELLHDGQEIIVQVVKDPLGTKGARLTTQITLPARYLVYMPYSKHIGISQKIEDDSARERLRNAIKSVMEEGEEGGYILRTMAEAVSEEELKNDIRYLRKAWSVTRERISTAQPSSLVHEDLTLAMRAMRDLIKDNVEKVRIDSRETFQKACDFAREFIPEVEGRIEYYPGERPIFDLYSVEDEIHKALERRVLLKSGGYLIIDQTEAMTTIDVNTGTYVGRKNLEETLFKTNLEAAQAIARQLRLRNLGGIIIVDFIDMTDDDHKRQVLRALEKALARDRTKLYVTEMSLLGLVEITRKRTRESLERILCAPCPVCDGRGVLKTAETVCYEIFREILREARQFGADKYLVLASQVVVDMLLDEEAPSLVKLQEFIGRPIQLQVEALYNQEQFDVILV
ncbi:MAG TPA: ribonuclease G [Acidiferrobacterales bacterium]|nr:ribonuclease G [Acidiferrobacterales bacterium]